MPTPGHRGMPATQCMRAQPLGLSTQAPSSRKSKRLIPEP